MIELRDILQDRNVPGRIIETLLDEGYDLKSFGGLTMEYLRLMKFKVAEIQILQPVIEEVQNMILDGCLSSNTRDESNTMDESNDLDESNNVDESNNLAKSNNLDESNNFDELDNLDESDLVEFFSDKEFKSLSEYEKQSMVAQLRRYRFAQIHNKEAADKFKPPFVQKKEAQNQRKDRPAKRLETSGGLLRRSNRQSRKTQVLQPASPTSGSTPGLNQSSVQSEPQSTSSGCFASLSPSTSSQACEEMIPSQCLQSSPARSGPQDSPTSEQSSQRTTLLQVFQCSVRSDSQISNPGPSQSSSRPQTFATHGASHNQSSSSRSRPQNSSTSEQSSQRTTLLQMPQRSVRSDPQTSNPGPSKSSSQPQTFATQGASHHQTRVLTEHTNQTIDDSSTTSANNCPYEHVKPELPKFHILQILEEKMFKDDAAKVFNKLKAEGILRNKAERKMVIRFLTRHLYSLHSSDPTSLTTLEKEGMAKSFVNTFPKYCGKYDDSNLPWDHVYCRKKNTGWIANASRTIQASNRSRKSKSKPSSSSAASNDECCNPEELDSDEVQSLSLLVPGRAERHDILEGMGNSFKRREKLREKGADIPTILLSFPHLLSYEGELLRQEFKRMRPQAKDICRTFLPLQDKILRLPTKYPIHLTHEDGTIRALMILSQHLPHDVPQRKDRQASSTLAREDDVIQYIGTNENVDEFIAQRRAELARPVQPYLLAVRSTVTKKIQRYFLVLDDKCMQLTNCQTIRALDHLMASYFVFNVDYPYGWRNTLHFIASTFYEIFENTPPGQRKDSVTPSERELYLLLQN